MIEWFIELGFLKNWGQKIHEKNVVRNDDTVYSYQWRKN